MKIFCLSFFIGGVMLFFVSVTCISQPVSTKIPLTVTDSLGKQQTIHFGVDPLATNCADSALGEWQLFPDWCWPFDCPCLAFTNPHYNSEEDYKCYGEGQFMDLRPYYSSVQIDTFIFVIKVCDTTILRWPSNLGVYYDSVRMVDTFFGIFGVDMVAQDSFVWSGLSGLDSFRFFIITKNPKQSTSVFIQSGEKLTNFLLQQNYPNPFNPSTTINYQVTMANDVTLKVYDVFGREVLVLVNGRKPAGEYNAEWNATGLPSGVYFSRLQIGELISIKKMILLK